MSFPRPVRLTVFAALLALPLLLVACTGDTVVQSDRANALSVSGQGEVTADPDTAILTAGVSVVRESVAVALADAANSMQDVIDTLDDAGVAPEDITTANFSIFPEFDFSREGERTLRGFRVSNDVSVKIRTIDEVGSIIDDIAAAGGDDVIVNGIAFTVDDPSEMLDQARALAVENATAKAEQLADLAGVDLGDVISLDESSSTGPRPQPFFGAALAEEAAFGPTPISGGQFSVTVNVFISYALR